MKKTEKLKSFALMLLFVSAALAVTAEKGTIGRSIAAASRKQSHLIFFIVLHLRLI